ncbi:MAG: DegT/DnrJ/EryC1/StrS family aminotransferase [Flavobacteriia bacterium]|jgi:dTDP-4-amino-4,6-dideoxygalactose transaminase
MINVTKTYLPDINLYTSYLQRAYDACWLTNRGELVVELEEKINSFLGIPSCILMTNGTLPIQVALHLLAEKGEVITTPFSYVATTSSILWEGCTPVFADIDPLTWTIDPQTIRDKITKKTTCILATHVFGNPCDVEALAEISKTHNIPIIYDGAHAFGVRYKGESIFSFGTFSTCSFHATKLFHCGEGGMLTSGNAKLLELAFHKHNFGHNGPLDYHCVGINAKMSELQAAMGLAVLPEVDALIAHRKLIVEKYQEALGDCVSYLQIREHTDWNYAYFPVVFSSEEITNRVITQLNASEIFPRRYFHPSLNTLSYLSAQHAMPVSESLVSRILCLPVSHSLNHEEVMFISQLILRAC